MAEQTAKATPETGKELRFELLGGFTAYYGGEHIMLWQNRGSKLMELLQYLIYFRGKSLPKDDLYRLIYGEDADPEYANTFRVLLHRLRKQLEDAGLPKREYISCKNNMCAWNATVPCTTDVEEFEQACESAFRTEDESERLALLTKAVELYRGELLPISAADEWVAVESARLKKLYVRCITAYCALLEKAGENETIVRVARLGNEMYPYDEELYTLRIGALLRLGRPKEAQNVFEGATNLFFTELGLTPSKEMQELYARISDAQPNSGVSLETLRRRLNEESGERGAFFCNYVTFAESYKFIMRVVERSGQSCYLMLCMLTDTQGDELEPGPRLTSAAETLAQSIRDSLRRGDMYTRCSPGQFLVLLVGINKENCSIVSDRIAARFKELQPVRGTRLRYKVLSASNFDENTLMKDFKAGAPAWGKGGWD